MKVFDIATGKGIEAVVSVVTKKDFSAIKRSKQFSFDWNELNDKTIYKLTKKNDDEMLGLMCLTDIGEGWNAIKIELLEVGKANVGKDKKVDKIAGCLIAYACRESVKAGHEGWVFLIPKTELERHYRKKYGFIPFGVCLASDDLNSIKLIKKYL